MLKRCLCFGFVIFILSYASSSEGELKQKDTKLLKLAETLDYLENYGFSGVVTVKAKDKTLLQKAYGYSNVKSQRLNTVDTKFPLLSMTKPMVAAGILLLQEQGVLDLNAPIHTYLTELRHSKNSVTLHHLLTHTSGLVADKNSRHKNIKDFLNYISNLEPSSPSGSKRQYCNMCYSLATAVLEKVAKMSWRDYLEESVLVKAGMKNAQVMGVTHSKGVATGYRDHPLVSKPMVMSDAPDYINEMWWSVAGARGVLAGSNDVIQWLERSQTHKLISAESHKRMFTAYIEDQGYGWHIDEVKGHKRYWKGGGAPMYETQMVLYPELDIKVVLLLNNNMGWRVPVWSFIEEALFGELGDELFSSELFSPELQEVELPFKQLINQERSIKLTVIDSSDSTIKLKNDSDNSSITMNLLFDTSQDSYWAVRPIRGGSGLDMYRLKRDGNVFKLTLPNDKTIMLSENKN